MVTAAYTGHRKWLESERHDVYKGMGKWVCEVALEPLAWALASMGTAGDEFYLDLLFGGAHKS